MSSGGIAKLTRPLTPAEAKKGFTGKVTADGRALVRFQGRVFAVPASTISGLVKPKPANQTVATSRFTAPQRQQLNTRIAAIVAGKSLALSGGGSRGGPPTGYPANDNLPGRGMPSKRLQFGANDLVYGPSAGGQLRKLQQQSGGKLLTDLPSPPPDVTIQQYSKKMLDHAADSGQKVHFDLTHVSDIDNVLAGKGQFSDNITSVELRYIRDKWDDFKTKPSFYRDGVEIDPPWRH